MYSLKDKRWFYTPTENTIAITDNKGNRSVYDTNNNPDYTDIVAEHLYQTFEDSTSEVRDVKASATTSGSARKPRTEYQVVRKTPWTGLHGR